jgi:hypothetical protein
MIIPHPCFLPPAACTGGPYTFPTQSTPAIDASKGPVVFKWDPACLTGITTLDLSLYASHLDVPVIKVSLIVRSRMQCLLAPVSKAPSSCACGSKGVEGPGQDS